MTNETLETIKNRRSCRAYKPEQITNEELDAVLEAGTYAASAMGRQSAKIVVALVRKVKLPGVISLRKDLPICPIPKGIFLREVLCTFLKLTKIPCAVSGLK